MSWTMIQLMVSAVALFWAGVAALTAFAVQLAILNLTGRRLRPLRWAPLAVPALALGWGGFRGSVIEMGAGGALLLGWALAWAVYKIMK